MTTTEAIEPMASPPVESGCMMYVPTFGDKVKRFLGYKFELGQEPKGVEDFKGWARTDLRFKFTVLGRIRLLFSGKLKIDLTHYANLPIDQMRNRVDVQVLAPWERD